jgi:ribosomal protein S2
LVSGINNNTLYHSFLSQNTKIIKWILSLRNDFDLTFNNNIILNDLCENRYIDLNIIKYLWRLNKHIDLKVNNKVILFATSKSEIVDLVKDAAIRNNSPYISGRWVGGLFTNFEIIRKRINRMIDLVSMKEKGELKKYTKKEQSLMDKEVERLEKLFIGVKDLNSLPAALIVVDPKKEFIAVEEANTLGIPVIAIANTDCKISNIQYPILANDSSRSSVDYILHHLLG